MSALEQIEALPEGRALLAILEEASELQLLRGVVAFVRSANLRRLEDVRTGVDLMLDARAELLSKRSDRR